MVHWAVITYMRPEINNWSRREEKTSSAGMETGDTQTRSLCKCQWAKLWIRGAAYVRLAYFTT